MGGHKYFVAGDAKVSLAPKIELLYCRRLTSFVRLLGSIVGVPRNRQWQ